MNAQRYKTLQALGLNDVCPAGHEVVAEIAAENMEAMAGDFNEVGLVNEVEND